MLRDRYVYFLYNNEICYLGKGQGRRWKDSKKWLESKYGKLEMRMLRDRMSDRDALVTESYYITLLVDYNIKCANKEWMDKVNYKM